MVPLFTRETAFGQNVGELVFGVKVFDLDFWVEFDCQITNRAQLRGFGTRVSSSHFCAS